MTDLPKLKLVQLSAAAPLILQWRTVQQIDNSFDETIHLLCLLDKKLLWSTENIFYRTTDTNMSHI